jgi:SAM-dependent methyltransferase
MSDEQVHGSPHTPQAWGRASRGYAEQIAPALMRAFTEEMVDRLDPSPDAEALEVAAGSGALTTVLAPRVRSLLATDFASEMVAVLRERLESTGASNVRTAVMDGQSLDLEDSSFDVAGCAFALMLFPDRAKGFAELARVLRPGGRAVVSGWTGPERFELFGLFLDAMRAAFPDMPPPPNPPPVFSLADPKQFQHEMEAGGFRDVDVGFVTRDLHVATVDEMWSLLTAGAPPIQVLFDRVGDSGRERLRGCLADIVEERFGGGSLITTNVATVAIGVAA